MRCFSVVVPYSTDFGLHNISHDSCHLGLGNRPHLSPESNRYYTHRGSICLGWGHAPYNVGDTHHCNRKKQTFLSIIDSG